MPGSWCAANLASEFRPEHGYAAGVTKLPVDDNTLRDRLLRAGVAADRIAPGTFKGKFRVQGKTFPLHAHVEPTGYLTLAVVPFLKSPADPVVCARLYRRLLELNHGLLLAKFAVDDDLDVFLCTEYPTADLDDSELRDAVDVLSTYAAKHHDELVALCAAPPTA